MKQVFSGLMLVMLCVGMLTLTMKIQPVKAASLTVPDDYSTIQDAIDHASPGDTVYVRAGTYREHIDINQSITLKGESNQNTIIEARYDELRDLLFGIWIIASDALVENFKIIPFNYTEWQHNPSLVVIDGRDTHCSNDTIKNNILVFTCFTSEERGAIEIMGSENNTVADNQIIAGSRSDAGLNAGITLLFDANHNTIDNNTIIGGWTSIICVMGLGFNIFTNNYMTGQIVTQFSNVGAIYATFSDHNVFVGNTLIDNELAFGAYQSSSTIYHNNFINNTQQAFVDTASVTWDQGYPSGGNYWSGHNGTDMFSGSYQNRTGSDGIGDTPYQIDPANTDPYPLMRPWMPILAGDINGDGKVDLKDLVLLAFAYGSVPGDPNWDENADLDGNGRVSLTDLVTLALHYGQHNP